MISSGVADSSRWLSARSSSSNSGVGSSRRKPGRGTGSELAGRLGSETAGGITSLNGDALCDFGDGPATDWPMELRTVAILLNLT